ncbi:uncharacterized protein [Periplaneta americana]|uniref:uncharacterized protein n=1 Tax=Periplaneta americana TaxID=6978 RepID=UPI0037E7A85C
MTSETPLNSTSSWVSAIAPELPSNSTNSTVSDMAPNIPYMVCEVLVAVFAVVGNALVILVFYRERRLRRRTNYYIVSLAIADLLVGMLGIPFAILASMGLPRNLYACLFTVSLLVVLCTISIFCLVAVSVDRYWAILHPMGYSRNVRTKTAIGIICVCWVSGTLVGFLPLLGWHNTANEMEVECLFTKVMDYNYLVFLYFATIIAPALLLAAFYAHIYRVVLKQLRQIVTMNPTGGRSPASTGGSGTMLRMLGAAQKREVKATQNLSIIVLFFIICWIPLYTINCVQAFCQDCVIPLPLTNFCIILSHANSAVNPLLYAYHLRDFRAALKNLLCCMFASKEENTEFGVQGTRFGSHNTLHHHGVTPTRNNSIQSLQQIRMQQPQQIYTDFSTATTKLSTSTMISGTNPNLPLSTMINNMNTIHQNITALPLSGSFCETQPKRVRMRTLTEMSSNCEDEQSCVRRRSSAVRVTGQVNSAYIEDSCTINKNGKESDVDSDDDDVFYSTAVLQRTAENSTNPHPISAQENVSDITPQCVASRNSLTSVPIADKDELQLSLKKVAEPAVHSVFELQQSNNYPCEDTDVHNMAIDDHEKTELSPCHGNAKEIIVASSDPKNCRNVGCPKLDSLYITSDSETGEDNNKSSNSPVRKSPLKFVGELLVPSNSKKSQCLKEDSACKSCEIKTNDNESTDYFDEFGIIQTIKDMDTHVDGNLRHKNNVAQKGDDMGT